MIALWCVLIGFGIRGFQDLSHRVNTTGLQTPGTPSAQYVHWVHQFSPAINDLTLDVLIHRRNTAQAFNSFSPLIAAIHHHVPQWSVEDIQQRGPWTAIIWSTGTAHWIPALSQYAASEQTLTAIVRHFDRITQDTTFVTGAVPLQWTFSRLAIRALENAARFTLPMTLILLLVVFQSWSAALFVPLSAMSGSLIGLGVLGLWPTSIPVTSFTTEAGMMLGLGVGIDYGMMWWASLQRTDPDTNIVIRYVMAQQRVRQMVIPAAAIVILSLMALMFFSSAVNYIDCARGHICCNRQCHGQFKRTPGVTVDRAGPSEAPHQFIGKASILDTPSRVPAESLSRCCGGGHHCLVGL